MVSHFHGRLRLLSDFLIRLRVCQLLSRSTAYFAVTCLQQTNATHHDRILSQPNARILSQSNDRRLEEFLHPIETMATHSLSDSACAADFMHSPEANRPSTPTNKPATDNNELQAVWDETMKGVGGVGLPHEKCAVLLISWEAELDDLHTGEEVDNLEAVFKDMFRYTVVKKQLVDSKRLSFHIQAQKILLDFVVEYDDENTLLIVYYAGHGVPGKQAGEDDGRTPLLLAGNRQPSVKTNERNSVVWDEAEMIVHRTKGDVLIIFDCCFAGVLAKRTRSISDRNFEFLAACGSNGMSGLTEMPGPNSFTSALIWALTALVKSKSSFTTQQLLRKINADAPNFPRHQLALIEERGEDETSCFRKLVLAPLPTLGKATDVDFLPEREKPKTQVKHYLDLRFFYDKPPTKDEIVRLSSSLKELIVKERITARHIGWLRVKDVVKDTVDHWKRRMTIRKDKLPAWTQKLDSSQSTRLDIGTHPHTPPLSDFGAPDSSVEVTPEFSRINDVKTSFVDNIEVSAIHNIENMTVSHLDSITLNTSDISAARLKRMILGGPDHRYKLKVVVVGLVVLILECFHRLRPREAPAIVLLSFCGYAWWTSRLYHRAEVGSELSSVSSYFPLLIGGISLFICTKLLFTDGVTK